VAGSGKAEEGGRQAEVEKQTGGQKHAGREERGCGQGRVVEGCVRLSACLKQTEAMWQEEACSHLETGRQVERGRQEIQAGREADREQPCKGTEAGGCRGRQSEVGR
jgi:hypothetical protein